MEGILYANLLSCFREMEKEDIRYDTHEGVYRLPDDFNVSYKHKKWEVHLSDVRIVPEWTNHVNLICMSIIDIPLDQRGIRIPSQIAGFGDYGVIINDYDVFRKRVYNAVTNKGDDYVMGGGPVKYGNERTSVLPPLETVLYKRKKYRHEHEYRIVIYTGLAEHDPLILNIGSLENIATPIQKLTNGC